jgi:hypothetical protein
MTVPSFSRAYAKRVKGQLRNTGQAVPTILRLELDGGIFSVGSWFSRCHPVAPKQSFKKRAQNRILKD